MPNHLVTPKMGDVGILRSCWSNTYASEKLASYLYKPWSNFLDWSLCQGGELQELTMCPTFLQFRHLKGAFQQSRGWILTSSFHLIFSVLKSSSKTSISTRTHVIHLSAMIREASTRKKNLLGEFAMFMKTLFYHSSKRKLGIMTHMFQRGCSSILGQKAGCQHWSHKEPFPNTQALLRINSRSNLVRKWKWIHLWTKMLTIGM